MITAMEIRKHQFSRTVRGLKEEEVKNYLNQVAVDYENLYSENSRLKEEIQRLEFEIRKYRSIEETMNNSLILAQQTAQEYQKNAKMEAENLLEASRRQIADLLMVYQEIIKRMNLFNAELKAQVSGQADMLDKNQKKIDELSNFFYAADMKNLMENLEKISVGED
ncbi:cell division initiation protein diviva [hydrocarbon metagenome]|uniref:Cell division initiation protein diviva n=1 Tax=hydrocarbon metagenome TaxID=938273 RepID=A0A0W8E251_9ZZZZ